MNNISSILFKVCLPHIIVVLAILCAAILKAREWNITTEKLLDKINKLYLSISFILLICGIGAVFLIANHWLLICAFFLVLASLVLLFATFLDFLDKI